MTDEALTPDALTSPLQAPTSQRPRIRWAGIVWGVVFAALALAGMSLTSQPGSLDDFAGRLLTTSVGAVIGYGLLAVGALVLIIGLVGLLRHAQVALARRTEEGGASESAP